MLFRSGEHFSLGNFWAAVQRLQAQMGEHQRVSKLYAAKWPPLSADDVLHLDRPCGLCGDPFIEGDILAQLEIDPVSAEDAAKKRRGEVYNAACDVVHKRCYERAAGLVRYVEARKS